MTLFHMYVPHGRLRANTVQSYRLLYIYDIHSRLFPVCTPTSEGTGKSTTIWHLINARVDPEARVLVTCTRNQAVDAVTEKVESLGVLVRVSGV